MDWSGAVLAPRGFDLDWWDLYAASHADAGIEGWAPNYQGLGPH